MVLGLFSQPSIAHTVYLKSKRKCFLGEASSISWSDITSLFDISIYMCVWAGVHVRLLVFKGACEYVCVSVCVCVCVTHPAP